MNQNEIKKASKEWGIVVLGTILAFVVSIGSNAAYDLFFDFTGKRLGILFGSLVLSVFMAELVFYMIRSVKEETTFCETIRGFIRSWFYRK